MLTLLAASTLAVSGAMAQAIFPTEIAGIRFVTTMDRGVEAD